MRFKLHIDNLEPHPGGKGFFNIEPTDRQLIFGIPSLVLPFISYMISREINSKFLGSLIVVSGIIILIGIIVNLGSLIQNLDSTDIINTIKFTVIIIIATFLIILGSWKIKKYTIRR
jgi:predicted neutral ceramidase superfamily lipid hydrolase